MALSTFSLFFYKHIICKKIVIHYNIKKTINNNGFIITTPDRNTLWNAQTPQIFEFSKILKAHINFVGKNFTDDSLLFEQMGYRVHITEGDYSNFKITTIDDLKNYK